MNSLDWGNHMGELINLVEPIRYSFNDSLMSCLVPGWDSVFERIR